MKQLIVVEQSLNDSMIINHHLKMQYKNHVDTFKKFNFDEDTINKFEKDGLASCYGETEYGEKRHYTLIKVMHK